MQPRPHHAPTALPPTVAASLWRGDSMARTPLASAPTGWDALNAQLPGKGWPRQSLVEILQPQPGLLEWRLTATALQQHSQQGQHVVAIGPPMPPHASGLAQYGLAPQQLVWIDCERPQERAWALEQLIRANACGVLLAWLPQAHPDHIRRLQISAQQFEGLVFIFRPEACLHQASAAPLRLVVRANQPWSLQLQILKRRGPPHVGVLDLPAIPHSLQTAITPRMLQGHTAAHTVHRHDTALGRLAAPRLPVALQSH